MLEEIYDLVSHDIIPQRKKKVPVPVETLVVTACLYFLSNVSLWEASYATSNMVFTRHGTLMTLGTGPFISGAMAYNLAVKDKNEKHRLLFGLALSLAQSVYMGFFYGLLATFALSTMSFVIFNAIRTCDELGDLDLSSALILASASHRFFQGGVLSTLLTVSVIVGMAYLNQMHIPIGLTHTKSRQSISARLPVMYSGNTPLVVFYTLAEYIPFQLPMIVSMPLIYMLALRWPEVASKTGSDVLREYEEKNLTLKGWRDKKKMGQHIHRQVETLVRYNAAILVIMAVVSDGLRPSVNCGTLLIVTQTLQHLEPQRELRTLQRQIRRRLKW